MTEMPNLSQQITVEIDVVESTMPRFIQIMTDLDVNRALRDFTTA